MRSRVKIGIAIAAGILTCCAIVLLKIFGVSVQGLSTEALCALVILVGAIVVWICSVLPEYVVALIMVVLFIAVLGVPTEVALSAFSTSTWWLLLAAFGLGLGMQRSGLLQRMANGVLRIFPPTFKAQVAAFMAAGTIVGPFIPSLSAKATILAPLCMNVSDSLGYERKGRQASGLFLAMFTGLRNIGPAVISASVIGYGLLALLPEDVQQNFDMLHWFLCMLPWFIVVTLLNYVAIVLLYRPKASDKKSANATGTAAGSQENTAANENIDAGVKSEQVASSKGDNTNPTVGNEGSASGATDPTASANSTAQTTDNTQRKPWSRKEKQMLVIIIACVALWVLQPITGIEAHIVAIGAFVATVICGIFNRSDFRSGMSWDSLIFIGAVIGLAEVFSYLEIDTWIVDTCQPIFTSLAANPYLFVAGIGVVTVLLRFVIVSEMAYINIFMIFMVPLALGLGINPWVVGVSVYAMVNPWFALYQNPIYLTAYYAVDGKMVRHADMAKYCVLYVLICLAGLMVSVPYWQMWGLF